MVERQEGEPITIVCLTFNRPWTHEYQRRLWSRHPVHLVIVDGTRSRSAGQESATEGGFRYTYVSSPGRSYLERLGKGASLVDTAFVALLDDEDAYSFTGLQSAARFLTENPDYTCVSGLPAQLTFDRGRVGLSGWRGQMDWTRGLDLSQDEPIERIETMLHGNRSANVYYSLARSAALKRFVTNPAHLYGFENWAGGAEFLWTFALLSEGKYRIENYPLLVRAGGYAGGSREGMTLRQELLHSELEALVGLVGASNADRLSRALAEHHRDYGPSSRSAGYAPASRKSRAKDASAGCQSAVDNYLQELAHDLPGKSHYAADLQRIARLVRQVRFRPSIMGRRFQRRGARAIARICSS